jgi:hypothetical protein
VKWFHELDEQLVNGSLWFCLSCVCMCVCICAHMMMCGVCGMMMYAGHDMWCDDVYVACCMWYVVCQMLFLSFSDTWLQRSRLA